MNIKSYNIKAIRAENFRNYKNFEIIPEHKSVVITGKNGAGKTSVLEAISLLSPGKGMRGASNEEIAHNKNTQWVIYATVTIGDEEFNIGTGITSNKHGTIKRVIKVNGELINSSYELAKYFSVLWVTPQTDHNFLSSSVNKRKFVDRMVYNFNISHANLILEYEKKVKERSLILKLPKFDSDWIEILEKDISILNYKIYIMRNKILNKIKQSINKYNGPFPKLHIEITGSFETLMYENQEKDEQEILHIIFNKMKQNRRIDTLSGKTNFGTHRSNIEIMHYDTKLPISNCSTGEQKAMLVALLLHQVYVKKEQQMNLPVLLLDEITAHLDKNRRIALMETIQDLGVQAWLTGTESDSFSDITFPAEFLNVDQGIIYSTN